MTKAEFTTKGGMKVLLEGHSREIAEILEEFERRSLREDERRKMIEAWSKKREETRNHLVHRIDVATPNLTMLLTNLIKKGFFDQPKKISEVMRELEREGISPPSSTVHPLLARLVINSKLKRERNEGGFWEYKKCEDGNNN